MVTYGRKNGGTNGRTDPLIKMLAKNTLSATDIRTGRPFGEEMTKEQGRRNGKEK